MFEAYHSRRRELENSGGPLAPRLPVRSDVCWGLLMIGPVLLRRALAGAALVSSLARVKGAASASRSAYRRGRPRSVRPGRDRQVQGPERCRDRHLRRPEPRARRRARRQGLWRQTEGRPPTIASCLPGATSTRWSSPLPTPVTARSFEDAVKAGKDAYCEKPLAVDFGEAKSAYQAVKKSRQVVQIGTQRRSERRYVAAGKADELRHSRPSDTDRTCNSRNPVAPGLPPREGG